MLLSLLCLTDDPGVICLPRQGCTHFWSRDTHRVESSAPSEGRLQLNVGRDEGFDLWAGIKFKALLSESNDTPRPPGAFLWEIWQDYYYYPPSFLVHFCVWLSSLESISHTCMHTGQADQQTAHTNRRLHTLWLLSAVSDACTHPKNYFTYINKYKTLLQHYHNWVN
jgi:hypothetical protein